MSLMKVDQHGLVPKFSNLWEDFFGKDIMETPSWSRSFSMPAVNIEEKDNAFEVSLAVPGMQRDDFKIEVDNGVLRVASEKKPTTKSRTRQVTIPGVNLGTILLVGLSHALRLLMKKR